MAVVIYEERMRFYLGSCMGLGFYKCRAIFHGTDYSKAVGAVAA